MHHFSLVLVGQVAMLAVSNPLTILSYPHSVLAPTLQHLAQSRTDAVLLP